MNNETFIDELNSLFSIEAAKNLHNSLSQCTLVIFRTSN